MRRNRISPDMNLRLHTWGWMPASRLHYRICDYCNEWQGDTVEIAIISLREPVPQLGHSRHTWYCCEACQPVVAQLLEPYLVLQALGEDE